MEYFNEDVLIIGDEDIFKDPTISNLQWRLKSGPRGLLPSMSIVIHKSDNGNLQVLKNRYGSFKLTDLPGELLDHIGMDKEERRIMSKGW